MFEFEICVYTDICLLSKVPSSFSLATLLNHPKSEVQDYLPAAP